MHRLRLLRVDVSDAVVAAPLPGVAATFGNGLYVQGDRSLQWSVASAAAAAGGGPLCRRRRSRPGSN